MYFFGPISNISVLSEFKRRKLLVIQSFTVFLYKIDVFPINSTLYFKTLIVHVCGGGGAEGGPDKTLCPGAFDFLIRACL